MRKVICLRSRYGEVHKLVRIGEKSSHLFLFVPASNCYRIGYKDKEMKVIEFIDPSGGPYIKVGTSFANLGGKKDITVNSISMDGSKVIIELE